LPPYTVFVAYIGNEYGMEVARFVDQCLSEHDMLPQVALFGTRGEIHAIGPNDIIEDRATRYGFPAVNSESLRRPLGVE